MGKEVQKKNQIIPISNEDELFEKISELIENARSRIRTAIDTTISVHSVEPFQNKLETKKVYTAYPIQNLFTLSWSHYEII